jgi:ABC-type uncharacterized transport system auxiliary subunit
MTPGNGKIHALVVVTATLVLSACTPTRPPLDQLDAASRALGAARDAGAPQWALAEYRAAGSRFDEAQAAQAGGDYDEAAWFAEESLADSELAIARSRLASAREAVSRLQQENAALERDLASTRQLEDMP